ncbi:hypothetical protein [Paenibacillus mucilaginosus]|uniref:Uncharacterized protein n=2 Tax=Paenibacillus mucilaginosus TaxID=61624 RepID=I0BFA6_9BACL|nr:hypothetical protein [Paenibacillus mucilaginosus]AEI40230.1 hypothetical protein KNP414_01667 [Paenibacillus mucilaginosus KNP414]AFH61053.1 hypothetical protein B2K_10015 [Paenibacillus mucilaginosus K02]MCG7213397.1 hypothetical protein [Paenibacillus mucilaginosus]WDM29455.1 hypothetical protein KCX80_09980 [Paenibacillus mucilaginosus]
MVVLQILAGILLAVLFWKLVQLTVHILLTAVSLFFLLSLVFPGVLLLLGSLLLVMVSLIATLALLCIGASFRTKT